MHINQAMLSYPNVVAITLPSIGVFIKCCLNAHVLNHSSQTKVLLCCYRHLKDVNINVFQSHSETTWYDHNTAAHYSGQSSSCFISEILGRLNISFHSAHSAQFQYLFKPKYYWLYEISLVTKVYYIFYNFFTGFVFSQEIFLGCMIDFYLQDKFSFR